MARMRSPKDWFPTSGEARGLIEVKGRVGGKGGNMRSRYRRRGPAPNLKMAPLILNNASWDYNQPNLIWRGSAGDAFNVTRLMNANATNLGGNEGQPTAFVKKLIIEAVFMAGIGKARVDGTLSDNTQGVRDDIPQPGIMGDTNGYTGALLSGTIDNSALVGPTSWMEGVPANLFLAYESIDQAAEDPNTLYGSFSSSMQTRNKQIFWSKQICPTAYRPEKVRISKVFPGRGLRLSQGAREIETVALILNGYTGMGTVVFPVLTMAIHRANVWYTDDEG